MSNKGGRPTVMTTKTLNKLEEAFSWEWSDSKSCDYDGISHPTLWKYQNKHPEFVKRNEMLKSSPGEIAKKNVVEAITGGDLKLSQWFLERRDAEFSPKKQVDLSVNHQLDAGTVAVQLQQLGVL